MTNKPAVRRRQLPPAALLANAAAERATELDRTRLRAAQQAMIDVGDSAEAKAAANRRFHQAVWTASHNPTLVDLLHRLNVHLVRYPTTTLNPLRSLGGGVA